MITLNRPALAGRVSVLLSALLLGTTAAAAFDVSAPEVSGRLAVYFIRDAAAQGPRLETLDEALRNGKAVVMDEEHGLEVKNLSNLPLFIPFGALLRGGLQDQVVAASQIIPPHSDPTWIDTYCIDPFRGSARFGESRLFFDGVGALSPSRTQKLSLLVGAGHSGPVTRLRQAGVWWSIDTLRTQLAAETGAPLTPRIPATWDPSTEDLPATIMQGRREGWRDSLPLALDDARLAGLEAPIADALAKPEALAPDIVGAAFAIDGQFVGAESFQSPALFQQMWPAVLRGYAVESLAEHGASQATPPNPQDMKALLTSAETGGAAEQSDGAMNIRDGASTVVAELADDQGRSVAKSYVAKLEPRAAALAPDGTFVQMLASGEIDGRPIDTLTAAPILAYDTERQRWAVREFPERIAVPQIPDNAPLDVPEQALLVVMIASWIALLLTPFRNTRLGRGVRRRGAAALRWTTRPITAMARLVIRPVAMAAKALRAMDILSPIVALRAFARPSRLLRLSRGVAR